MKINVKMRIVSCLVALSLGWSSTFTHCSAATVAGAGVTLDDLKSQFPNARFVEVTMEEYLLAANSMPGYTVDVSPPANHDFEIAQVFSGSTAPSHALSSQHLTNAIAINVTQTNNIAVTNATTNAIYSSVSQVASNSCEQVHSVGSEKNITTDQSRSVVFSPDFADVCVDLVGADWGSDGTVVLFVVIGLVVVAATVVYAGAYLYRVITNPCDISYWWDIKLHLTALSDRSEHGYLVGGRLCSGFIDHRVHAGIAIEAGYFDVKTDINDGTDSLEINGAYGMAGPHIRWLVGRYDVNPTHVFVELLGGITSRDEIDLISAARAGFVLRIGEYGRLGLNIGAMYSDLELDEGLVRDSDNYSLIIGTECGFRF